MDQSNDTIIARVRVREVAGIFRSRDALDATVDALLESGFDRADIALSSRHAARQKLGIDIPAEEIPEVPAVPRRPFFGPEDVTLLIGMGIGILMFAGAALGAFAVVASGGSSAAAALAALVGGTIVGSVGAWIVRRLRREHVPEIDVSANWCCSCGSVRPSAKPMLGRSSRRTERKRCGCTRSRSTSGCRMFR